MIIFELLRSIRNEIPRGLIEEHWEKEAYILIGRIDLMKNLGKSENED